jgi:hypothetical protein
MQYLATGKQLSCSSSQVTIKQAPLFTCCNPSLICHICLIVGYLHIWRVIFIKFSTTLCSFCHDAFGWRQLTRNGIPVIRLRRPNWRIWVGIKIIALYSVYFLLESNEIKIRTKTGPIAFVAIKFSIWAFHLKLIIFHLL